MVAGILLALNPFLLSESRVARVEALSAELVALSVMTLMLYFHERRWRWLALSGILGGLALSTKSQNLLLVGFAGLAGSGRSELFEALFGLEALTTGVVNRCAGSGKIQIKSASQAVNNGKFSPNTVT